MLDLLKAYYIPFELNLRNEKWLVIPICRPPSINSNSFLNYLIIVLDHFQILLITSCLWVTLIWKFTIKD